MKKIDSKWLSSPPPIVKPWRIHAMEYGWPRYQGVDFMSFNVFIFCI